MKNNTLVLIDWIAGLVIAPAIIIVKLIKKLAVNFYQSHRQGRLIIKFLGAGNYVAMSDVIDGNTTLISALSNKSAIEHFLKPQEVFYIDDSNFFSLVSNSFGAIFFVLKGSFHEVINLETESKFSKLLATLARSELTLGLTNAHKSYLDALIYDQYLVNPMMLSKSDSIRILTHFDLVSNEYGLAAIEKSQSDFLNHVRFKGGIKRIIFAPTGSDTNKLRRLGADLWKKVADRILLQFPDTTFDLIFPNNTDWQYESIHSILGADPCFSVRIGGYGQYLEWLAKADLVVCIDSQTLHIASKLETPVICFFGPTSPYGVNHSKNVYPISRAAMCSPCMHKYFSTPCADRAICMNFNDSDLQIFNRLGELCI